MNGNQVKILLFMTMRSHFVLVIMSFKFRSRVWKSQRDEKIRNERRQKWQQIELQKIHNIQSRAQSSKEEAFFLSLLFFRAMEDGKFCSRPRPRK